MCLPFNTQRLDSGIILNSEEKERERRGVREGTAPPPPLLIENAPMEEKYFAHYSWHKFILFFSSLYPDIYVFQCRWIEI